VRRSPVVEDGKLITARKPGDMLHLGCEDRDVFPAGAVWILVGADPSPDVDREADVQGAIKGINFPSSGRSCSAASRLLIHEWVADEVVTRIIHNVDARRIAAPLDPNGEERTVVNGAHYDNAKVRSSPRSRKSQTGDGRRAAAHTGPIRRRLFGPCMRVHVPSRSSRRTRNRITDTPSRRR
jgi:Aldehyde dehydrogenase family